MARPALLVLLVTVASMAQADWRIDGELADILPIRSTVAASEISDLSFDQNHGHYIAVADSDNAIFTVSVDTNVMPNTVVIEQRLPLSDRSGKPFEKTHDFEGVSALANGTFLLSDELDQSLKLFGRTGRLLTTRLAVKTLGLHKFSQPIKNKGIEALTTDTDGQHWILNEEQLPADSGSDSARRYSRLLLLSADLHPGAQWAYPLAAEKGLLNSYGISAIEALPNGELLVLERVVNFDLRYAGPALQHKIYLIAPNKRVPGDGYNVSGLDSLANAKFTALKKRLLWQGSFGRYNFEAMAIGEHRDNGSYPLLLMSDDGQGLKAGGLLLSLVLEPRQ